MSVLSPPKLYRTINSSRLQTYLEIIKLEFPWFSLNDKILVEWDKSDENYYRLGYLEYTNEGIVWQTSYEFGIIEDIRRKFNASLV
jgi:hypothetical protein